MPTNIEAEQATLGAILFEREAVVALSRYLQASDFSLAKHGQIYAAAQACLARGTPPDLITIPEELRQRGQLEGVGGLAYLTDLLQACPTSSHAEHYGGIVADLGWKRAMIRATGQLVTQGYQAEVTPASILQAIETYATQMRQQLRRKHSLRTFHLSELWEKDFPPLVTLADGVLFEGLTLFSGKPKMGKSLLTLDIAAAMAAGGTALGTLAIQQGDVLYLALEDPEAAIQERLESLLHGRPNLPLWYRPDWPAMDAGGLDAIDGWLSEHPQAKLVVIDTFTAIAPSPDGKKSSYQADYDALKGLQRLAAAYPGLAIIANTHSRKAGAEDVLDEISGTTGKSGGVDHVWVMRRQRGDQGAELHIQPRRAASSVRSLTFDQIRVAWTMGGDAEVVKLSQLKTDILAALAEDSFWPKDLAEFLGANPHQVRRQLHELKKAGYIEAGSRGKYQLTHAGTPPQNDSRDQMDQMDQHGSEDQRIRPQAGYRSLWDQDDLASMGSAEATNDTQKGVSRSDPSDPGDPSDPSDPSDPRFEILNRLLKNLPPRERFFVRMYLSSNKPADHHRAREKIEAAGASYTEVYRLWYGSDPLADDGH